MLAIKGRRWGQLSPEPVFGSCNRTGVWELQIVRRCDRHRFVVLPKRWIVERTLAWISRCRRLARDYERHACQAAAFVRLAMIRLMLRRLAASP
jgi:transposase